MIDKIMTFQSRSAFNKKHPQFGILLPLVEKAGSWQVLFEKRSLNLNRQPGEICFPGGEQENEDANLQETAVRECCEELGIAKEQIEVISALDYFVNHRHMFIMAYLGIIRSAEFAADRREVEEIFTVPLDYLLAYQPRVSTLNFQIQAPADYPFELIPGGKQYPLRPPQVPQYFYEWENHVIWGLTANILTYFLDELKAIVKADLPE